MTRCCSGLASSAGCFFSASGFSEGLTALLMGGGMLGFVFLEMDGGFLSLGFEVLTIGGGEGCLPEELLAE